MHTNLRDLVTLDRRVNDAGLAVVGKLTPDDLDLPTPCAEWTLRDLLAHMTTQHHGFAAAARGNGADEQVWHVGPLADDPVAGYATSVADVDAAFDQAKDETEFLLPEMSASTPFPAAQAVSFHLVDGIAHGWDVARALGIEVEFDAEALEVGLQIAESVPDGEFRLLPGAAFRPVVPAGATPGTLDRIVAALGRSSSWSPAGGERGERR